MSASKVQIAPAMSKRRGNDPRRRQMQRRKSKSDVLAEARGMRLVQKASTLRRQEALGTLLALVEEAQDQNDAAHWNAHTKCPVILPTGTFRQRWDLFCLFLLIYVAVITPFSISFVGDVINGFPAWELLFSVDRFVDFIFLIDIVLNFRTAWTNEEGKLRFTNNEAMCRYAKSWLLVDVLSVIPYELFTFGSTDNAGNNLNFLKLLRILRLVKVAKVLRAARILKRMEQKMSMKFGVLHLARFFITILLVSHWMACGFYLVSSLEDNPVDSWINRSSWEGSGIWGLYTSALYWSVMTITTIGYGDIPPGTTLERWYAIVCMFIGAGLFSFVVGTMCSLIQDLDINRHAFERKMDSINEYMTLTNFPVHLKRRIRAYCFYQRDTKSFIPSEQDLYSSVSPALRQMCALYKYKDLLRKVPYFRNCPKQVISELALHLTHSIFMPGECIISEQDVGHEMYFIQKGKAHLEMIDSTGIPMIIAKLTDGDHFGERGLLYNARRIYTVRCLSYCDTCLLDRDEFKSIMQYHPDVGSEVRRCVVQRMWKHIMKSGKFAKAILSAARTEVTEPVVFDLNIMQTKIFELQELLGKQMRFREVELQTREEREAVLKNQESQQLRRLVRENRRLTREMGAISMSLHTSAAEKRNGDAADEHVRPGTVSTCGTEEDHSTM